MDEQAKSAALIRSLIEEFYAKQDGAVLRRLLMTLMNTQVRVPMNVSMGKADEAQFRSAKPGETITTKEQIRMKPDMLKNSTGELFFPVFTDSEEAPENYRQYFTWVTMDFMHCVRSAFHNEECTGVVVNAFSTAFPINKLILQLLINQESDGANKSQEPYFKG